MKGPLFWTLSSRISLQFFSFLRVIILARILTPYDFGISASTFIAYQLLEMLTFTGFTTALTAYKGRFEEGYPTLWWATFIRGVLLFLLLFSLSGFIGEFFKDDNVSFASRVIAISFIPSSLTNPVFIVEANRFFQFKKIFILETSEAFINTLSAITLAYFLKDFRAMIYAFIIGAFSKLVISYILRPYMPTLSFSFAWLKSMLSFGVWVNLTFVITFFLRYLDRTFVGKFSGQDSLGYYSNAQNFAFLVPPQLSSMVSRVLFPYFVSASEEESSLAFSYYLRIGALIGGLFFAPMFFWSEGFITLVLGDKWINSAYMLKPLSVAGLLAIISNTISPLAQGKGIPKLDVMRLSVIPTLFVLFSLFNIKDGIWIAWSLALGYAFSIPVWLYGVVRCGVPLMYIFKSMVPLTLAMFMGFLVYPISGVFSVFVFILVLILCEYIIFKGFGIIEIVRLKIPQSYKEGNQP